jgi:dipeptidyl aminopeptidase/acylaminoacyl peptidase
MIMRLSRLVLIALFAPAALAAQARRPITHEDVFLMKRLASPALSPDGRWAVISVTEPSYTESEATTDLWIVPADGSAQPRRLTSSRGGEGGATWSPDGRRIAFSARREGDDVAQLYILDIAGGGEAQRVTTISTGAGSPQWRPDGRALLFVSRVHPGAASDSANRAEAAARRARRYNARVYEGFPIRFFDQWLDDLSPHLFVVELEGPGSTPLDLLAGTRLAAEPGFGSGGANQGLPAVWAPDGESVIFAASRNRNEAAFAEVVTHLFQVSSRGGEPRQLTTGGDYTSPRFSPDGRTLYALASPSTEFVFNHNRLVAWAWPALGAPRTVAGDTAHSAGAFVPSPDGRSVYLMSQLPGRTAIFRAAATGDRLDEVGRQGRGSYGAMAIGGTTAAPSLVAIWESAVNPPELVRVELPTGRTTPLTRFNAERAAQLDWQPVREFWFTSSRGRRIHNFVVVPPGFDSTRQYPLFTVIHGGPHSQWLDQFVLRWNYHLLGAPGYVVLLTNYTGSTGFGERFARNIQGDPLRTPGDEINEAVDEAIRQFRFVDANRLVAGGASYGGHLANWLAVTSTRYRALISHAGLWDLESQYGTSDVVYGRERNVGSPPWEDHPLWRDQSPMRHAGNLRTPVLVTVGERDYRVPMNNAIEFWTALQRMRVPSRFIVFPTENHWILNGENSRFFYREVHAWIARWLEVPAPAVGGS